MRLTVYAQPLLYTRNGYRPENDIRDSSMQTCGGHCKHFFACKSVEYNSNRSLLVSFRCSSRIDLSSKLAADSNVRNRRRLMVALNTALPCRSDHNCCRHSFRKSVNVEHHHHHQRLKSFVFMLARVGLFPQLSAFTLTSIATQLECWSDC